MIDQAVQPATAIDVAKPITDPPAKPSSNATTPRAAPQAATRVHVDQDGSGVFVYRLIDVATGRVLVELPREQADALKKSPDYVAGVLLSTQA